MAQWLKVLPACAEDPGQLSAPTQVSALNFLVFVASSRGLKTSPDLCVLLAHTHTVNKYIYLKSQKLMNLLDLDR